METPNLDLLLADAARFSQYRERVPDARSELSALHQRCEDLSGLLGWAMHCANEEWEWLEVVDPDWCRVRIDANGIPVWYHLQRERGTGLPLLTPEARTALRGGVK